MNEHRIQVIKVTPDMVSEHDNADTLSVVTIDGFTVCTQTAAIPEGGGLAAYIEPDSLVNTELEEFDFLKADARYREDSVPDMHGTFARIRVKKLRGTPSMGLLVWLDPDIFQEGQDVTEVLGVEHYEPPNRLEAADTASEPSGYHPRYTDLNNFKKAASIRDFVEGEDVVATEKLHGANARYCVDAKTGELCVGSQRRWLKSEFPSAWKIALERAPGVKVYIADNPTHTVYGEIYGPAVQGGKAGYGQKDFALAVFDILKGDGTYMSWGELVQAAQTYNFITVPVVYMGPYNKEKLTELAEGLSPTHEQTVMEGLVVKPIHERPGKKCSRVVAKLISNRYYLKSE